MSSSRCKGQSKSPVFNWSPLPQKRTFSKAKDFKKINADAGEIFYPNCDATVWLRSCTQEIVEPLQGTITGTIPLWLNGALIRNGPGSLIVGNHRFDHLFDSAALLHRFHIKNGNVTYQCRFLKSDEYKKNFQAKRIIVTTFGTSAVPDPCQTIFNRIASVFDPKANQSDNAMISVYPFGDELFAFTECPIIHKVNVESLETEKKVDVSDHVAIVNHTSHPHVMNDGTVYNLSMSVGKTGPHHKIICFPSSYYSEKRKPEKSGNVKDVNNNKTMFEQARFVASIPARWPLNPSYMHTFGITENYFVIVEQPLNLSVIDLVKCKFNNKPLLGAFQWFYKEQTKISVVSRKTGKLKRSFFADAFFYLHIINQYEAGDYVVIDICCYRDPKMIECMYIDAMKNIQKNPDYGKMFRGRPLRFVLPLNARKSRANARRNLIELADTKAEAYFQGDGTSIYIKPERICELGCETPRIHYERYLGKPYRYFYAISSDVDAENPGTIIKVDVENKTALTWCEDNCYPSEPIFVPAPNAENWLRDETASRWFMVPTFRPSLQKDFLRLSLNQTQQHHQQQPQGSPSVMRDETSAP